MQETIIMELTKSELKALLMDYCEKKYGDKNFNLTFETKKECVGLYEISTIQTRVKLKRKIKIGDHFITIEEELEEDTIKEILSEELSELDYEINNLRFKNTTNYVGLYEDEVPTFKGLSLILKRKQNQYRK